MRGRTTEGRGPEAEEQDCQLANLRSGGRQQEFSRALLFTTNVAGFRSGANQKNNWTLARNFHLETAACRRVSPLLLSGVKIALPNQSFW